MKERIIVAVYKPKRDKLDELQKLVKRHYSVLKKEGLVTDRKPIIAKSSSGAFIEVFGWKSSDSIAKAHKNETIQRLWEEFANVCDYVPLSEISESENVFCEFEAVE